jgi:hypothetical protein
MPVGEASIEIDRRRKKRPKHQKIQRFTAIGPHIDKFLILPILE